MLRAIVGDQHANATPQARGICPSCGSDVIAKCGLKVVWHWAHTSCADCDHWSEPETAWHAAWKSRFAETEKTIRRGSEWHRADAVTPTGVVLEFQHSVITAEEVADREHFYGNMVWVLDATAAFRADRVGLDHQRPQDGREFCRFRWKHRRRSFDGRSAPVFLDLGVAFKATGDPFSKSGRWWDDIGIRDGIARGEGVWQRTSHTTLLLEVKKQRDAYGWGRVWTHDEFCRRYGASNCVSPTPAPGLLSVKQEWHGGDGHGYYDHTICPAFNFTGDYDWCEKQLNKEGQK